MENMLSVTDNSVEPWRDIGDDWREDMPSGWLPLLDKFEEFLQNMKKENPKFIFEIGQLKEKFGAIRLYYSTSNLTQSQAERLSNAVDQMEKESEFTCNVCGTKATHRSRGWVLPYCRQCAAKAQGCKESHVDTLFTKIGEKK